MGSWRGSLRFRLLALAIVLAAAGMIAVNVVATVVLRTALLDRVDADLMAVPSGAPAPPPGVTEFANGLGGGQFLSNHVITRIDGRSGAVLSQVVGPAIAGVPLPDLTAARAAIATGGPVTDSPVTVGGVDDPGYRYRIRVLTPSGAGASPLVIAQSLADVEATLTRVATVDALLSVVVIVTLIGAGIPLVAVGLRPLTDVERAAEGIAAGDFSVRSPHAEVASEVGSLARTFNGMVDQIEGAFAGRAAVEEQLRRFLTDASHELRTPLTSIRAYAELFRQGALVADAASLQAMARIEAEAKRMGVLVDDLLLLARLDQHPELRITHVDLHALVSEVFAEISATARDHVLLPQPDSAAPLLIEGDDQGLHQVVSNLVRNAVLHTPAGTRVLGRVTQTPTTAQIHIEDDGPGMTTETAAHVFERFYRPDSGRVRGVAGTGLGLAIVDSITHAHSGTTELHTAPGGGAHFIITLPLTQPVRIGSEPTANRQVDQGGATGSVPTFD
ncbi:MAG: sensor histidine kinase [Propionicimonas sp.]